MRQLLLVLSCFLLTAGTISGIVVDENGRPVGGVRVAYVTGPAVTTDADGRFAATTFGPAVVFRKPGFESLFLSGANGPLRVVMHSAPDRKVAACQHKCDTLDGYRATLCFQVPGGVEKVQGHDADFGYEIFRIKKPDGWKAIRHSAGPLWGDGFPVNSQVFKSVEYSEQLFDNGSFIDAHGKTAKGTLWRQVGRFGESAEYDDLDEATARVFDKILDSVCLAAARQ